MASTSRFPMTLVTPWTAIEHADPLGIAESGDGKLDGVSEPCRAHCIISRAITNSCDVSIAGCGFVS